MNNPQSPRSYYPQYSHPAGIPVADRSASNLLMKAIRVMGKMSARSSTGRKGLIRSQTVVIKRKKRKFQ